MTGRANVAALWSKAMSMSLRICCYMSFFTPILLSIYYWRSAMYLVLYSLVSGYHRIIQIICETVDLIENVHLTSTRYVASKTSTSSPSLKKSECLTTFLAGDLYIVIMFLNRKWWLQSCHCPFTTKNCTTTLIKGELDITLGWVTILTQGLTCRSRICTSLPRP